ncbi:hypothetical protein JOD20_000971 [Herpetosiphon giganteus]|nr:hypothetical protein [Herpetosiphon giganteus]
MVLKFDPEAKRLFWPMIIIGLGCGLGLFSCLVLQLMIERW